MILTKTVMYRGKPKPVSELRPSSQYRVKALCPVCGDVRTVYLHSLRKAGHCICHACMLNLMYEKQIEPGTVFSRLTVLEPHEKVGYSYCRCECGKTTVIENEFLRRGHTQSCGCLKKEAFKNVERVRGSRHGRWKGGVSSFRNRDIATSRYKTWRVAVFERDEYTCQSCGKWGRSLNAHHIYNYSDYPEKRYDVDNGVTLCYDCHSAFHAAYGRTNTTRSQFIEFLQGQKALL